VLLAAKIFASEPDPDQQVQKLQAAGFTEDEAAVLTGVLPEAFAIPALMALGVTQVSELASAQTKSGREVEVALNDIPIFVAALALAHEHRTSGVFPHEVYKTIAEQSALIDAANKALNAGESIEGATVAIAFIGATAEALGWKPE